MLLKCLIKIIDKLALNYLYRGVSLINMLKNGLIINPITEIIIPIIIYSFLYNAIIDFNLFSSLLASGSYNVNIIAGPTPNSTRERTDIILVNKPLTPRYSFLKF